MRAMNVDGTVMSDEDLKKEQPAFTYEGVSRPIFDGYYEYIASYFLKIKTGPSVDRQHAGAKRYCTLEYSCEL